MISRRRKQTFVLVIPQYEDIFHSYYAGEIIRGVTSAASRISTDILIHITDRSDHRGWLDSSLLNRNFVNGIIFADIDNDVKIVKKAIRYGMPCIALNNQLTEPINCIYVDNEEASFNLVNYLVECGHRKIATISGDLSTQAGVLRLLGYKKALDKNGIRLEKDYITKGDFLRTPARAAAKKLLNLSDRPTAVFAASDVMALELIAVAKEMNLRVPEDLSVIGFDNNSLIESSSVKLTTVQQPLMEMGRLGAENLYLISKGKAVLPVKIPLLTKLIKRDSVKKLKTD